MSKSDSMYFEKINNFYYFKIKIVFFKINVFYNANYFSINKSIICGKITFTKKQYLKFIIYLK